MLQQRGGKSHIIPEADRARYQMIIGANHHHNAEAENPVEYLPSLTIHSQALTEDDKYSFLGI